jgi:hypothetical protein
MEKEATNQIKNNKWKEREKKGLEMWEILRLWLNA